MRRVLGAGAAALICASTLGAQNPSQPSAPDRVTFNRDIAPLMWQKCAGCHRPGQVAPFSLVSYEDVRPRVKEVVRAVASHSMPPWKPDPGLVQFKDVRSLSTSEVALIERWASQGAEQGHPADLPQKPAWVAGWQLGEPDLVVSMPEAYQLQSSGRDVFRTFVIPIPMRSGRFVRALEFHPGNFKTVHHANIKIDGTRFSRQWDEAEPGPGYSGGGSREARFPDGHFLGWTPGQSPRVEPPGMSWRLEPDSDLVLELHMMPTSTAEAVRASVGFFFTDEPPSRTPYMLRLGRQDLDIAAGRRDYVNTDSYTLPVDVQVLAVQPHAHYLARHISASATLPDGSTRPLISISDWDFHWQDVYYYAAPLALPKGTVIAMRYTYDNSAANRRNPNRPPRRVTFGQTSSSEMGSLWLQVLPSNAADLAALDRDFSPKILADDIAGNEKWLEMNPGDAQLHAELGMCYYEAGRANDALTQLTEAARLDPSPARHYDIGRLLLLMQRFPDAAGYFNKAIGMKPDMAEAHYGLGLSFDAQGRVPEAIAAYERALALNISFADAHFNLARVLSTQGRTAEALTHYQKALELRPGDKEAQDQVQRLKALPQQ